MMLTTTIMIKLKATTLKQHQVQVQVGEIGNRIYFATSQGAPTGRFRDHHSQEFKLSLIYGVFRTPAKFSGTINI